MGWNKNTRYADPNIFTIGLDVVKNTIFAQIHGYGLNDLGNHPYNLHHISFRDPTNGKIRHFAHRRTQDWDCDTADRIEFVEFDPSQDFAYDLMQTEEDGIQVVSVYKAVEVMVD